MTGRGVHQLREDFAPRTNRRSFLALAASTPFAGLSGCLDAADDALNGSDEPVDWFDIDYWSGQFTYTRHWQQDRMHWSGEQPTFEFVMDGVFAFEYSYHGDDIIGYHSEAPASWSISGGGGREGSDSWQVIFSDNGTYWPELSLLINPSRARYELFNEAFQLLNVEVTVAGSESEETTGYYEAHYGVAASDIRPIGYSSELPPEVGPLRGETDWDGDAPNAIETQSIVWELEPGRPAYAEPDDHPCDGTDLRDGLETAAAESLRDGLADGFGDVGVALGPEHVTVVESVPGGDLRYSIRLGYTDNLPRHTGECIVDAVARGELPPGVEEGSAHKVVGMAQQVDGHTRLSMRVVDVETTEVVAAATGEASGTEAAAIGEAAAEAAGQLDGFSFE